LHPETTHIQQNLNLEVAHGTLTKTYNLWIKNRFFQLTQRELDTLHDVLDKHRTNESIG